MKLFIFLILCVVFVPVFGQEPIENQQNHNEVINILTDINNQTDFVQSKLLEINTKQMSIDIKLSEIQNNLINLENNITTDLKTITTNTEYMISKINDLDSNQNQILDEIKNQNLAWIGLILSSVTIFLAIIIFKKQSTQSTEIHNIMNNFQIFTDKKYNYAIEVMDNICKDIPVIVDTITNHQIQLQNPELTGELKKHLEGNLKLQIFWFEVDKKQFEFTLSTHADVLVSQQVDRARILTEAFDGIHKNLIKQPMFSIQKPQLEAEINKLVILLVKKEIKDTNQTRSKKTIFGFLRSMFHK